MKKFVVLILVLCLAFAGFLSYLAGKPMPIENETSLPQAPAAEGPAAETAVPVDAEKLDYEALYALHEPDEVVMVIDGKDISWGEYFSWLYMSAMQTEQYFVTMANYGMPLGWDDPVGDDSAETYGSVAVTGAENTLRQLLTIEGYAQAQNVEPSEETLAAVEEQRRNDMIATVGEEGTEEDFAAYLKSLYRSEEAYQRASTTNYLNAQIFADIYGMNCEKVSDEQALAYLDENSYLHANHILLATIDLQTGAALEEDVVAEKKAQAEALVAELQAIEEPEELVERFLELKEEYCEDSGKVAYPNGYVFLPGEMVAEFEEGCKALENYGVSQPIETSYGYHIILRLPQDADAVINYDNMGNAINARGLFASFDYAGKLDAYLEEMQMDYAEGFEPVDLADYVK